MSGIMTVRSAARVLRSSRTGRRPPDSLAVRSIQMHCPSRLTLPIGTATASSQRRPVNAKTIATSPRPDLNWSSAWASRITCGMLGMMTGGGPTRPTSAQFKAAPAAPLARRQRRALPLSGSPGARRAS